MQPHVTAQPWQTTRTHAHTKKNPVRAFNIFRETSYYKVQIASRREDQNEKPRLSSFFHFITPAAVLTEAAFAELLTQQQRPLLSLALRLVGNLEDAKDLAQTAFIKLWEQRHRLHAERPAPFYLRRILVNLCIDHLRRAGKHEPACVFEEERFVSSASNAQQQLEAEETNAQLRQCLHALPAKQKAALLLRDIEGHTVAETAALLSCSQNTVLVNLHLARKKVKEKMQEWLEAQA